MKTFHRICVEDTTLTDGGKSVILKRGREYLTSSANECDEVVVFTSFWIHGVPVSIFTAEREFTK